MTSQKQIEANRRNALLSTGPRTEEGKGASRQNAVSHGLTAETVIVGLEEATEYESFEAEIVAEYDPKSVIERELTRRLASLLWRLRRSSFIEAGLLSFSEMIPESEQPSDFVPRARTEVSNAPIRRLLTPIGSDPNHYHDKPDIDTNISEKDDSKISANSRHAKQRALTVHYMRLANLSSMPLERISRYETSLWRQFVQVLFSLDQAKYHRIAAMRGRFTPRAPQW